VTDHQWSELAAPYALGALAPDERARFEAHLAECAACRGEVRELREVTVLLADAAPSEAKAAALAERARLLMLAAQMTPAAELATAAIEIAERTGSERVSIQGRTRN